MRKVSRSRVIREAKRIYKGGRRSWADSLSLAWHQVKLNVGLKKKRR